MRNTVTTVCLLWTATLLYPPAIAAQDGASKVISFPEHKKAVSPDNRYVLVNVDNNEMPYYHTVFLEDRKQKTHEKLFTYERGIELLWNPDSDSFVLNDYAGSDYAICSIISIVRKQAPVLVLDELLKKLSPDEREAIQRNDHLYIAGVRWVSPTTLRVKIWGHDSDRRRLFSRFYLYRVRETSAKGQ